VGILKKGLSTFLVLVVLVTIVGVNDFITVDFNEETPTFIDYTQNDFKYLDIQGEYEEGVVVIKYQEPEKSLFTKLTTYFDKNDNIFEGVSINSYEEININSLPQDLMILSENNNETWYKAYYDKDVSISDVLIELASIDSVVFAEPNYYYNLSPIGEYEVLEESDLQGDPSLSNQYYLDVINITDARSHLESIGINGGGSRDVIVAIIDSGVDYTHPDLAPNMWINTAEIPNNGIDDDNNGYIDDIYGANTVSDERYHSGDPMDDNGHGTHVAGIIGAKGDNGIGIRGVADNVRIMAIKAGQSSGILTSTDIAEAIDYAVEKGADVINMSFGGYSKSLIVEDALAIAFSQAVLIAAAGNDGLPNVPQPTIPGKDMYPAAFPWVIGVMATNGTDIADFSNFDYLPEDSHEYQVSAPGVGILSTLPDGKYALWNGTSMSAPVVSGIAALLKSKFNDDWSYSSRFIMGQIVGTADAEIPVPKKYTELNLTKWTSFLQVDAYKALTIVPEPDLSFFEYYIFDGPELSDVNDGDGVIDAGETIQLAVIIRNQWGRGEDVNVSIDTLIREGMYDPYVTMVTDTVNYGAVGSFSTDDNGFIYNEFDKIVGIENPFTFIVDPDTPNDHQIIFNINITALNGLDPEDTTLYEFDAGFFTIDTRSGAELPNIIEEDMTLTNDKYWIIDNSTLIPEGVTVTVEPGTKIQFWSSEEEDVYAEQAMVYIKVQGELILEGTEENPIKLFPSNLKEEFEVNMFEDAGGIITMKYTEVLNPRIQATLVDHCFFSQNTDYIIHRSLQNGVVEQRYRAPYVYAEYITNNRFWKLGLYHLWYNDEFKVGTDSYDTNNNVTESYIYGNLFDSNYMRVDNKYLENNVFLNNFVYLEQQYDNRSYAVSEGVYPSSNRNKGFYDANSISNILDILKIVRNEDTGTTYIAYSNFSGMDSTLEDFAEYLGGHLAVIETDDEFNFIENNFAEYQILKIGLKYDILSGTHSWVNNFPYETVNWDENPEEFNITYPNRYATLNLSTQQYVLNSQGDNYLIEISGDIYVNDIVISNENLTLGIPGEPYQVQYDIVPFTADRNDLIWSSSDETVATVSSTGVITPLTIGETVITVKTIDDTVVKTINLEVIETITLNDILISESDIYMDTTEHLKIDYNLEPYNTTEKSLTWSSSDETVASVDEFGNICPHKEGDITITLSNSDGSIFDTVQLHVVVKVQSIEFDEEFMSLSLTDEDTALNINFYPTNATTKEVSWLTSDENIAYVDENGILVKVGTGTVVLRATAIGTNIYDEIILSISEEEIAVALPVDMISYTTFSSETAVFTVLDNGTLWSWGSGYLGFGSSSEHAMVPLLVDIENVVSVSSSIIYPMVSVITDDGSYWGLGTNYVSGNGTYDNSYFEKNNELSNVSMATHGNGWTIVLKDDGTVWSWGNNNYGQLGDGTTETRTTPVQTIGLENIVQIGTTIHSSIYLDTNGNLFFSGGLNSIATPKQVDFSYPIEKIASGYFYSLILNTNNDLYSINYNGHISKINIQIDENLTITDISAGENSYYILLSDGTLLTYGDNAIGQLGNSIDFNNYSEFSPSTVTLDNVSKIFGGRDNGFAIDSSGKLFIWGANESSQIGNFSTIETNIPTKINFGIITDSDSPILENTLPLDTATETSVASQIILDFDEAVNFDIDYVYIKLKDSLGNTVSIDKEIILDKLIITPTNDLNYGETYTLEIPNNGIKDIFENDFNDYTLTFTTEEYVEPAVIISDTIYRNYWTEDKIYSHLEDFVNEGKLSTITNNAILNNILDPNLDNWMRFYATDGNNTLQITNNYFGTIDAELVDKHFVDFDVYQSLANIINTPYLLEGNSEMYPFVTDVRLSNDNGNDLREVGAENITVTVTFNRDMDMAVDLGVYFGPDYPYTDYKVPGEWLDSQTWVGTAYITPLTGDGKQFFRIRDGVAADDGWLNIGDDDGRFMFEIITSGTESLNLQANGSEGRVSLTWMQDDFDLLAGYNVYRSTEYDGVYERINTSVIPAEDMFYEDYDVEPATVYFYKFTVMETDMSESDFSNVAYGAAYDTISPVVTHNPVTTSNVAQEIFIYANAEDNNYIDYVKLYFRTIGETEYRSIDMMLTDGIRYSGKITSNYIVTPGIEYYIEVSDGLSIVSSGTATSPYVIIIEDKPTIETMTPSSGLYSGGTEVTITGTNFREGATVYFSDLQGLYINVVDENTITVTTPAHFPSDVDVKVINPSGDYDEKFSFFKYYDDDTVISIPNVKAGIGQEIIIPIKADNLHGLIAADITIGYDSSALEFIEVIKGNITTRFSIVSNPTNNNQILLSMASSTTISGGGDLVYLRFRILETEAATIPITLDSVLLNSDGTNLNLINGQIEISEVYTISGTVTYYSNSELIDNVLISVYGITNYEGTSDEFGNYIIQEIISDDYILNAYKDDDINGISAYDATLILRAAVGLEVLNTYNNIAADVNSDGVVNSMDASQVLQYVAGLRQLPFEGAGAVWKFSPSTYTYSNLGSNQTNQNLTAILLGDVSGNFSTVETTTSLYQEGVLQVGDIEENENLIIAPFEINYYDFDLFSFETTIIYDSSVNLENVIFDTKLANCFVVINDTENGVVKIAVACANQVDLSGVAFSLYFTKTEAIPDHFYLEVSNTSFNEVDNILELMGVYNTSINPDLNNDGVVDNLDIQLLIIDYNKTYQDTDISNYDFNSDGIIDIFDIIKSMTTK